MKPNFSKFYGWGFQPVSDECKNIEMGHIRITPEQRAPVVVVPSEEFQKRVFRCNLEFYILERIERIHLGYPFIVADGKKSFLVKRTIGKYLPMKASNVNDAWMNEYMEKAQTRETTKFHVSEEGDKIRFVLINYAYPEI